MDGVDPESKFNVPGSVEYTPLEDDDFVLQSKYDERLRGYWAGRGSDGQLAFISDQLGVDHVTLGVDPDNVPVIYYDDVLSKEFTYDGENTIYIRAYS